jgi:integrase
LGPAWTDVRRLIVANDETTPLQLRNRAILLLLAVYGLRSGEIRGLRLEDIDWTRRILRVRRSKTARVQEHPLTSATGTAIQCYLKKARPQCARQELFLTCHAPFRRLSAGALYHLTSSLLQRKWGALRGLYRFALARGLVRRCPLPLSAPKAAIPQARFTCMTFKLLIEFC